MKRILYLLLALLSVLLLCTSALADVIIEPENRFWENHQNEMTYVRQRYEINSPDGWTKLKESPQGRSILTLDNGTIVHISWLYNTSSTVWGYCESFGSPGWIDLGDCLRCYDTFTFEEDHYDEIVDVDGDGIAMTDYLPDDSTQATIAFYSYPGADNPEVIEDLDVDSLSFYQTFTDENGMLWGYVGYYMGIRNVWVCLSDYSNAELPLRELPAQERFPAQEPPLTGRIDNSVIVAIALVAAVVVLTAVLMILRSKKAKQKKTSNQ